jgi:methylmalonyl-CoA mutase
MNARMPLAGSFPRSSEGDWRALVAETTGGRGPEALTGRSDDGIAVGPLYGEALDGAVIPGRPFGSPWTVVQRIDDRDLHRATRNLQADIEGGAGGIELVFETSAVARGCGLASASERDLDELLAGIGTLRIALRVDAGEETHRQWRAIDAIAKRRSIAFADFSAAFDPIATLAALGRLQRGFDEIGVEIGTTAKALDARSTSGGAVLADGRPWHDGGASEAQELAAALAAVVAYLRLLEAEGLPLDRAASRVGIALAADADEFLTIAKFRAMRLLHARVLEAANVPPRPCALHAETAWRMMSRRDPHVNILRTTAAVFSAGIGGADSVTVLPFDGASGDGDFFARRLARNGQTILLSESNLHRVADPGAGSGAIETLTERLAEAAWSGFQAIEAEGGLLAAVRSGALQRDIAKVRDERLLRVARRRIALTGISSFVNLAEASPARMERPRPASQANGASRPAEIAEPLRAVRLGESFEALRDRADLLSAAGDPPKIFLANLGRPADFAEAAAFAVSLFASGGVVAIETNGFTSAEAAAAAFSASGASGTSIACICVGRKSAGLALGAGSALKGCGARRIFLAGPVGANEADLRAAGIDAHLEDGIDAVALLGDALAAIG